MKKFWSAVLAGFVVLGFTAASFAQPLPPTSQSDPGVRVTAKKSGSKSAKKSKHGKKSKRGKHKKQRSAARRAH